jgi:hypothetical protein
MTEIKENIMSLHILLRYHRNTVVELLTKRSKGMEMCHWM